ncbi:hypothetical protein ACFFSW_07550 [Saccharothrix longispora]|uniref:Response regulator receiver domain-containing protein n=1 Tax=Saccharothrix longispora TaxID=33920 RepID=A0ABU1PM97_9PSEU|nr:hypothetical protein [Saccharothrix longispora]MDR6591792.1 hypothetical protein [Saccharothrix longispora]
MLSRAVDKDPPVAIRLLGAVAADRGGVPVPEFTKARAQVLALVALSGEHGITKDELVYLLPGAGVTDEALHRRISDLRNKCGIAIHREPRQGRNHYLLVPESVESIDAEVFVRGVAALSAEAGIAELDGLMRLWRDDPAIEWGSRLRGPWERVVGARAELIDRLLRHPELNASVEAVRFASLFPALPELAAVRSTASRRSRLRPRLLVVEDQIMADIRAVLDSEFDVLPVGSLAEWNDVCDNLAVDGALVDLHLTDDLSDGYGTTVIAEHLRKHTEIPVALMSVAVPPRYHDQGDMRVKYRLVDIVQKNSAGRLNGRDLLHAARELVAANDRSRVNRLTLWIDCDEYHVKSDSLFTGGRGTRHDSVEKCGREAEALRLKLRSGALDVDAVQAEVMRFHRNWGPGRPGARF